jgi:hypothetical protein
MRATVQMPLANEGDERPVEGGGRGMGGGGEDWNRFNRRRGRGGWG